MLLREKKQASGVGTGFKRERKMAHKNFLCSLSRLKNVILKPSNLHYNQYLLPFDYLGPLTLKTDCLSVVRTIGSWAYRLGSIGQGELAFLYFWEHWFSICRPEKRPSLSQRLLLVSGGLWGLCSVPARRDWGEGCWSKPTEVSTEHRWPQGTAGFPIDASSHGGTSMGCAYVLYNRRDFADKGGVCRVHPHQVYRWVQLAGAVVMLEGRVAIQKDQDMLEEWNRNLVKFNKGKSQTFHLRWTNPLH